MWYNDSSLIRQLGEALTNAEYFDEVSEVNDYFRRPQRYQPIYDVWETNGFPTSDDDDGWDEFVEGISDGEASDSDDASET